MYYVTKMADTAAFSTIVYSTPNRYVAHAVCDDLESQNPGNQYVVLIEDVFPLDSISAIAQVQ